MKKFIFALIALIFSLQSFAAQVSPDAVISIIDEFEYDLTVEWDQKDSVYLSNRRQAFIHEMNELKVQGLTLETLLIAVESKIDPDHLDFTKHKLLELKLKKISEQEALDAILESINLSRMQGASWSGREVFEVLGMLALAIGTMALVIYVFSITAKYGVNPKYCSPAGGWVDTNGNGFCDREEEVH